MLRRIPLRPKAQRTWMRLADTGLLLLWFSIVYMLLYLFASMNLRGAFSVTLILFGAHVGYTSLLFNRARAFDDDRIKRRTLVSAELALRATLMFMGCSFLGGVVFAFLHTQDFSETPMEWNGHLFFQNAQVVPVVAAFVIVFLLQLNVLVLRKSVIILIRRDFGLFLRPSVFRRRVSRKT